MFSVKRLSLFFIPLAGLVACAGTTSPQPTLEQKLAAKNYRLGEPVERILQYRLDGWAYLDREHVIMQTAPSTYYLVSLRGPCTGLSSAEVIAFTTTTSQLTRFDKLLVRNSGRMIDKCYIDSLHKLEKLSNEVAAR